LVAVAVMQTLSFARAVAARHLALDLMAVHGLRGWTFRFNRSKTNLGLCRYGPRVIELSVHFVERNSWGEVRDTLLHEIAHALVGPGHGHDAVWRRKCLEVGARPERLSLEADMPVGRWQAVCGGCGALHHKHRRPKYVRGWFCAACGPERGKLRWGVWK
jgi:predicted SprT family Zn-dependent metalloprotease